ncbi:MAG TPA: TetR/AcrR family transcriptional regulator [Acidimicrobiales bacterium]|nr:TetR/AcrR family transcriptional regulator [Acidimicrobiales bacterium]
MSVNQPGSEPPVDGARPRRSQAERSATTRQALLDAGRTLFAERGFAGASQEEIVELAGVTRGALSHHFGTKNGLFRAVVEDLHGDLARRIAEAAMRSPDPLEQLRLGCMAFLDAAMDRSVGRIILLDAPAVLGWQTWRQIDAVHGLGLVTEALVHVMDAGLVERQPVQPLAHLLLAALNEAAMLVANADDPAAARALVGATVERLLMRL